MLFFNIRKKLDTKYKEWLKKEKAPDTSINLIGFLDLYNLLNEEAIKEFLKHRENK